MIALNIISDVMAHNVEESTCEPVNEFAKQTNSDNEPVKRLADHQDFQTSNGGVDFTHSFSENQTVSTVPKLKNFEYETKNTSRLLKNKKTSPFLKPPSRKLIFSASVSTDSSTCSTLSAIRDGQAIANNGSAVSLSLNTDISEVKESFHADSVSDTAVKAVERIRKKKYRSWEEVQSILESMKDKDF